MPDSLPISQGRGLTVGLVVGGLGGSSTDPVHCGVRDYAVCLAQALRDIGVQAEVIAPANWRMRAGLTFVRALRAKRLDVVHLQYPSLGHRHSLLPHMLGVVGAARRCVVTLHEHSALPRVQRNASALFRISADHLVFTTEFEARAYGAKSDCTIIPIGSNVPVHRGSPERHTNVLYFGQVRPEKGLEAFLALSDLAVGDSSLGPFIVLGTAPPRWREYAQGLRAMGRPNVRWIDNAPPKMIAQAMASSMVAFLPFPDGASWRRGSLLAALLNGLPVMAPFGRSTTPDLRAVLLKADTPAAALNHLRALRATPRRFATAVGSGPRAGSARLLAGAGRAARSSVSEYCSADRAAGLGTQLTAEC